MKSRFINIRKVLNNEGKTEEEMETGDEVLSSAESDISSISERETPYSFQNLMEELKKSPYVLELTRKPTPGLPHRFCPNSDML